MDSQPSGDLVADIRKVVPFFREQRSSVVGIVVLALTTATASASEPLILKAVFDRLGEGGSGVATAIVLLLAGLVSLLLVRELLSGVLDWLVWKVRISVNYQVLSATVDHLHALPIAYHKKESVGAIMTKVERGITGTVAAFSDIAHQLLPAIVYLVVSIIVMLRLDARLACLVIAFGPIPAVVGAIAAKEQTVREKQLMTRWTRLFSRFNEVLSGMLVVKSFVMEEDEKRRFLSGVDEANAIVVRGVAVDARTTALKNVIMASARVAAIAVGGALVVRHDISLGTLLAFLGYVAGMFMPVQALTGLYQTIRRGSVALATIFSILDERDALGDAPDAIDAPPLRGAVEMKHVSFGYRPGHKVIRDVSFSVKPGECIALVGPSGAGKTTLTVLLQRLYDPTSGAIAIDGIDLRHLKQRSLRRQIGVVLQEGTLFSDSVHANIAFGRPGATRAEVEAAARAANAHDFVMALPEGYDTPVGERGGRLSGGERQRIAIARALLKDPPILILDEATSALDAESEALVQEALERLMKGRTSFVIAHRLSTVTHADRILVFRDGKIAEEGTHRELRASGGYYASLVERQARGLGVKEVA